MSICAECGTDTGINGIDHHQDGRHTHYSAISCRDILKVRVRVLEKDLEDLCAALITRRAMEPKHSDLDHTCPECELIADIIHRERNRKVEA
jgi:hypothetical protein